MKTDTKTKKLGTSVLESLDAPTETPSDIRLLIINIGKEAARLLLEVKILMAEEESSCLALYESEIASDAPFSVRELRVCGNDLAKLGYRGKEIGDALQRILYLTARGEIKNDREALLRFLKQEVK